MAHQTAFFGLLQGHEIIAQKGEAGEEAGDRRSALAGPALADEEQAVTLDHTQGRVNELDVAVVEPNRKQAVEGPRPLVEKQCAASANAAGDAILLAIQQHHRGLTLIEDEAGVVGDRNRTVEIDVLGPVGPTRRTGLFVVPNLDRESGVGSARRAQMAQ